MALSLHHGAGDLLEYIDRVRAKVVAGEVDVLCIAYSSEGAIHHGTAWVDDTAVPWCKAMAAVASLQHDLVGRGL